MINTTRDINFLKNGLGNINKTWPIYEHFKKYKLDIHSDVNMYCRHFYTSESTKIIVYIQDKTIQLYTPNHNDLPNMLNCVVPWYYRLFQQKKYDLLEVTGDIDSFDQLSTILKNSYKEFLFLCPADSDIEGNRIISEISNKFSNSSVILYSLEHEFNIPNQTLQPLKKQLDSIVGYSVYDGPNEFFNHYFSTIAHWIWNYNLNKNQKWLTL